MRTLYLFEIEADEKPIYNIGEWEKSQDLTSKKEFAAEATIVAYGEVENNKFIELYNKMN